MILKFKCPDCGVDLKVEDATEKHLSKNWFCPYCHVALVFVKALAEIKIQTAQASSFVCSSNT